MEKDADGFYTADAAKPSASRALHLYFKTQWFTAESKSESVPSEATEWQKDPEVAATDLIKSDYEVMVTLADQQLDPSSPLYSVRTFEELGLHADLLKGIYDMKFTKPSKIQERALPLLLRDPHQLNLPLDSPSNFIGQSQSGTGKTAAFVLTMLSRVDFSLQKPQALCLAPSRELARQIMTVVASMGKFTEVQTEYAIKDYLPRDAKHISAQVIVGTPGTMTDLVRRRVIDVSNVKVFVLDEADQMLDTDGLGDQTLRVKNMLPKRGVQIVLFSATFPEHVRTFADKFAPNANKIELQRNEIAVDSVRQLYMDCGDATKKYEVLVSLYKCLTVGQSIIFCTRRDTADEIARRMIADGHRVASLHGAKEASDRDHIIDGFRDGKEKVLITTNVVARGIDIPQVNMVVNYDLPLLNERQDHRGSAPDSKIDVEIYIHRIGRTGRFGRKGIAINFVHNRQSWQDIQAIEAVTGKPITRVKTDDLDEMEETLKKVSKN
ncbi:DEAD-domain-containing protein [Vararia minispora EC-137]|uniref:DEAD-domain-containing protein n=1 Tax=Vararia minispora EC-137 TaxID=1314806 RepID=A0ACB8QNV2_9AGAM|nr:DEAD-domain-containing protein [Vararia minispora EC-137]